MMLSTLLIGNLLLGHAQDKPVTLGRVFKKGEKYTYQVSGKVQEQVREIPLETFIPFDEYVDYKFTLEVLEEKVDGIVDLMYRRPEMILTTGETFDKPEVKKKEAVNMVAQMEVSPINDLLKMIDKSKESKKDPKKPVGKKKIIRLIANGKPTQDGAAIISQFTQTVFQLAMFVGSPDSALDFNPKLPYDEVKPGATWKRTVGYSPQRLSGSSKSAIQRLDFTYTYKGMVEVDGKKFHRVNAALKLETDAAEFINQSMGMKPSESGLEHLNLNLVSAIDFDLRPDTFHTQYALAKSDGGFTVNVVGEKKAVVEVKIKGKTEMWLKSVTK